MNLCKTSLRQSIFTSLDCVQEFHQIPLSEESKEYTAFSISKSHGQFKRLELGLRNAPAAFQQEIQNVLQEVLSKKVIVYIDNILVIKDTLEKHLQLVKVLFMLGRYGIKIKPNKCQWFAVTVDFLGHVISSHGIRKQQAFIDKVDGIPLLETVSALRELLGLINFQRKFIKDASVIQSPLSELTGGKKKARIEWIKDWLKAFQKLKDLKKEDIELAFPCYDDAASKMELWADASALEQGPGRDSGRRGKTEW